MSNSQTLFFAGSTVLCLETWRGFNGEPYMHSMHFCFSLGAFLAPLIANNFLAETTEGSTDNHSTSVMTEESNETSIGALFLVISTVGATISLGFLAFGVYDVFTIKRKKVDEKNEEASTTTYDRNDKILIGK